jgi:DNA-damage-inducible protein J
MTLENQTLKEGWEAFEHASQIAKEYGISDMSLDEINAEIAEARKKL